MQHMVHVVRPGGGWQSRAVPLVGLMLGETETVAIVPDTGNGNRLKEMLLSDVALCHEGCSTCPPEKRAELPPTPLGHDRVKPPESHPRVNTGGPIGPAWAEDRRKIR